MNKHTPGPWELTQTNNCWPGYYVKHHDNAVDRIPGYFAEIRAYTSNQNIIKANARLIAAAPDLLEALEGLLAQTRQYGHEEEIKAADAAITKAKGEV